eukprot:19427_1
MVTNFFALFIIFGHLLNTLTDAENTLNLFYVRHVKSQSNNKAWGKDWRTDSRVSDKGIVELKYIYDNFGKKISPLIPSGKILFESSPLVRAELTLLTAWKSLVKAAPAPQASTLKTAEWVVNANLRENTGSKSSTPKLGEYLDLNKKQLLPDQKAKWMRYFARGFGPKPICWKKWKKSCRKLRKTPKDLVAGSIQEGDYKGKQVKHSSEWKTIFVDDTFFPEKAEYIQADSDKNKWINDFGQHLRKKMDYKSIIVGGHGNWFHHFVNEFVRDTDEVGNKMKNTYGKKNFKNVMSRQNYHLHNGDVAHIKLEKYDSGNKQSVKICSIDLYKGKNAQGDAYKINTERSFGKCTSSTGSGAAKKTQKTSTGSGTAKKTNGAEKKTTKKDSGQQEYYNIENYDEYDDEYDENDDENDDEYEDEQDGEYDTIHGEYDDEQDDEYDGEYDNEQSDAHIDIEDMIYHKAEED